MRVRSSALASDPTVEEAASGLLGVGVSAVGAVVGGFFAAAGSHSGVLLGPVSLLVGGVGVGCRAFDGRICQPGLGIRRPRGFTATEAIPAAARFGIANGVLAALVANAQSGAASLGTLLKVGIANAQRSGATERAAVLRRIRDVGAAALSEASFVRPILRVAGPSEGGLVTTHDLAAVPDVDHPARERDHEDGQVIEVPWDFPPEGEPTVAAMGVGCAIAAVDQWGVFALLAYRRVNEGISIDELELEAPPLAVPVRRGVVRVRPGTRLPTPAPIALRRDANGRLVEAFAAPGAPDALAGAATLRLTRSPTSGKIDRFRL